MFGIPSKGVGGMSLVTSAFYERNAIKWRRQKELPISKPHRQVRIIATIETGGKAVSSKTYKEAFKISADKSSLRNAMSDKECQDT